MTTIHVHHPEPAFHASKNIATFLVQAEDVATGLEAAVFAAVVPLATLNVTLKVDIANLEAAQAAATSSSKSANAVTDRRSARRTLRTTLVDIERELTKLVAKRSVDEATSLILKAGFKPKKHTVPNLPDFGVDDGPNTGTVKVRIKSPAPGKRITVQFQASADNGATWPLDESGANVSFVFEGLKVGAAYLFRFRVKIGTTKTDWTVSAPFVVR